MYKRLSGEMPRIRIVDWVLLFVVVAAIYTFMHTDDNTTTTNDSEIEQFVWNKEDIREMCQFLEHEVTGEEGDGWIKGNEYENKIKLRGINVIFRHGERSPVSKVDDEVGCLPYRESDRQQFATYKKLAESDEFLSFLKIDDALNHLKRVPENARCESGMLTAEGALQHVRLGRYFKERYSKSKLMNEENQRIVVDVITSKYNRTLQSVLAFSSEFIYKQRALLSPIKIKASNYTYHCVDDFCSCTLAKKMRLQFEKEHVSFFKTELLTYAAEIQTQIQQFYSFPQFSNHIDPFQMIDISLGRYVCRRRTLPCLNDQCVTLDYFNRMINISTTRGASMFDGQIGISRRLLVVESYAILNYLKETIEKSRRFQHTNYIKIFSGHDTTVGPMLRVLGIPFVDPPHYTSRIVFEIYEHTDEGLYIRVLYNGRNRTHDIRFCKDDNLKYGMCKALAFEQFAKTGILELAKVEKFKDLCYVE